VALLRIRQFGDPALRQKARPIEAITDVHRKLVDDMLETMRDAPGVGLAAPQVGVLEQLFVWEFEDEHGVFVNPRIVTRSDETAEGEEGCLSLPGVWYPVERAFTVVIEGKDLDGNEISIDAKDWLARIFQHESDHLNGVLFIDHLPEGLRKEALTILRNQALGLPVDGKRPSEKGTF